MSLQKEQIVAAGFEVRRRRRSWSWWWWSSSSLAAVQGAKLDVAGPVGADCGCGPIACPPWLAGLRRWRALAAGGIGSGN